MNSISMVITVVSRPPQTAILPFLHFFFLGMVLNIASYTMLWTSIHSSSSTLSDLIPWIYLSLPLYTHKGIALCHTWRALKLDIAKTPITLPLTTIYFICIWISYYNPGNAKWEGSKITSGGDCSHEIKGLLLLERKVMTDLESMLKSRDITLPPKVHLVKAMVLPVVTYGCESWTVKKVEHQRIYAFELRCWRRLLRVSLDCTEI